MQPTRRNLLTFLGMACLIAPANVRAQAAKPLRFWNLTANTITELYVAAPGSNKWSPNLCLSDPDHTVEADERIDMPGITPGTYDVRVVDEHKRTCLRKNMSIKTGGKYGLALSEEEMKACQAN